MHNLLRIRYGVSEGYSPIQVETTIKECELPMKYIPYALALYVDEHSLTEHLSKEYPNANAEELRAYIAKRFFRGDLDYRFQHKDAGSHLIDTVSQPIS